MTSPRKISHISGVWRGMLICGIANLAMWGGLTGTAVAGDLLRGGYTMSTQGGGSPGSFTPPSLVQSRQNANDVLARTTQAIQSARTMQAAAGKLALSGANNLGINPNVSGATLPNVPNGLVTGGLQVDTGATWTGASQPAQTTTSAGETVVTVNQTSADAILTWSSFNIGKQTTLDFNQNGSGVAPDDAIAFNIVKDPSGVPSQILGSIQAPGQVYVINQNGIIFGGSSQVNVHTLVASSLPIDMALVNQGLLNNPDDQFLFSALSQPAGPNGTPAFTPPTSFLPNGADGNVTVQAGAHITSPTNADSTGGRVILAAPNVTNDGIISTPDGQTILAAGLQVGFEAHSSDDPTLRGLDVYVGAETNASYLSGAADAGTVTNDGIITVDFGDATMEGETVNQLGDISSATSVTLNGRIDLLADYNAESNNGVSGAAPFLYQDTGVVTMGPGSVTQILPDWASTDTVVANQFTLNSLVNVQGLAIHMANNSTVFAPSGTVNMQAGQWFTFFDNTEQENFARSAGQIYLDSGATIDVQGSWDVSAPVEQNIVTAQLLGPELADSPLQRVGPLDGQTIYIDIRDTGVYDGVEWVGTPLADVSGYVGLIQYNIGELTTAGGTVDLDAGGSVVMQKGSQVNVSGGWIDYQGGIVQTSEVISDGHIYPINEATPNLVYQGFDLGTFQVSEPKYGMSQTFTDPLIVTSHYEDSYVEGFNGGTLSINSPSTALDGQMTGLTVDGPRELSQSSLPAPSQLDLAFEGQTGGQTVGIAEPAIPPSIIFSPDDDLPAAAPFALDSSGDPIALSDARQKEVILSPDLFTSDGFGSLDLYDGDGNITVPAGVTLDAGPEGSITLAGANIDVQGSVIAPGGSLNFTTYDIEPQTQPSSLTVTPPFNPDRGLFTLGPNASLSTAGLLVDNRPYVPGADTEPAVISGGKIAIDSLVEDLDAGSSIDVSGGVEMLTSGDPDYGNGGSISIMAGEDPTIDSIPGGKLIFDATLLGYSGATGGSLTVRAPLIQIGRGSNNPNTLLLSPDFFNQGGFASFTLDGIGADAKGGGYLPAVLIASGANVNPNITSLMVVPDSEGSNLALEAGDSARLRAAERQPRIQCARSQQ